MEPIHPLPDDACLPTTSETIQDVIRAGRQMFAAGERLIRDLDRLRSGSTRGADWNSEFTGHPYVWVAASVGACLLLAAMFRRADRGEAQSAYR